MRGNHRILVHLLFVGTKITLKQKSAKTLKGQMIHAYSAKNIRTSKIPKEYKILIVFPVEPYPTLEASRLPSDKQVQIKREQK
jgi:hypothetical protein